MWWGQVFGSSACEGRDWHIALVRKSSGQHCRLQGFTVVGRYWTGYRKTNFRDCRRRSHFSRALSEFSVPKETAEDWPAFVKLMRVLRKGATGWLAEFSLLRRWYEP